MTIKMVYQTLPNTSGPKALVGKGLAKIRLNGTFNQDIFSWDTGAVTKMNGMFVGATSFNQNIGAWDVSSVQDMTSMFSNASFFNQDISNWNTGAVQNVTRMFIFAATFNQNISGWNISSVTNSINFRLGSALTAVNSPL